MLSRRLSSGRGVKSMRTPSPSMALAMLLGVCATFTGCTTATPMPPAPSVEPVATTAPVADPPGKRLIYAIIGPKREPARAVALVREADDVNEGMPDFPPIYAAAFLPDMLDV